MKTSKIKFSFLFAFMAIFSLCQTGSAQSGVKKKSSQVKSKNNPTFTQFVYQGDDDVYRENPLGDDEFYNPILQGCYPDPSITRKGNDYYLVNSFPRSLCFQGFLFFIPMIWLIGGKQIGHVLDRTSQLKVETAWCSVAGIYAPDALNIIHYKPILFYMITTPICFWK